MFGLFAKPDPLKQLTREYEATMARAAARQRNGDLHGYADLVAEAEAIEEKITALEAERRATPPG